MRRELTFRPIETNGSAAISARVVAALEGAIGAGRLRPGDRLPSLNDLSRAMRVSRTSVRDAVKELSGRGLLVIRHGSGVYVRTPEEGVALSERLARSLTLADDTPLLNLFEIRRTLETEAAAWAALRADPAGRAELRRIYAEYAGRIASGRLSREEAGLYDTELHRQITRMAGNDLLVSMMDRMHELLRDSRRRSLQAPGRMAHTVEEMGRIVDAICGGRAAEARSAMFEHIQKGIDALYRLRRRAGRRSHAASKTRIRTAPRKKAK